jgi:hypothetical protein
MSAQVTITQLPQAGTITGTELVPIVQNGQTVQTTTGAISSSPNQTQTFITLNQEPTLANSRALAGSTGVGLVDNGAQSDLEITLNGVSGSLETAPNGIIAKSGGSVTGRTLSTSGAGLNIVDGNGVSGNPTFSLTGVAASVANLSGTGVLALTSSGTAVTGRDLVGTASQINVSNGNGNAGNPTFSLANNAVFPGVEGITVPAGTTAERPSPPNNGELRYNTDSARFEAYVNGSWQIFGSGDGSVTSVAGVTNEITVQNGTTTPLVGLADNPVLPGSASVAVPAGTTAERPGSPVNGMFRYNSETALFEGYLNGSWQSFTSGGGSGVTSIATGTGLTGGPITSTGTISIDSTVVTLTGTQTLSNKTLASPAITGTVKLTGSGASSYTPFIQTFSSSVTNFNGYQLNYIQNTNNGSDASVDYVAYNDASDVDSYFIDMGIVSSNYTNALNTVFPANSGYVYTGGGTSGQAAPLLFGTSNTASDITFFTGGTLLANTRATIKGNTGNFLINTTTDTGYKLNVNGTTYFGGASTFGSTVLLNADPTLALQAATKQYVDAAVSTGFVVHPAVVYATAAALPANTYNNGTAGVGATLTANANGALSVDGNAVTTSQRILVKNEATQANNGAYTVTQTGSAGAPYILTRATDFDTAGAGEIANNAYFFTTAGSTNAGSSFVLSQTAAITVGTTALPFTLFNDQLDYVGGTNINVTGLTISLTGTVAATNGGTGTSTVTTGDLLYGSATNTWSKLPLGVAYKSLIVNASGTQMEWNAIPLNQTTAVSGQLGISNGGTGQSTASAGFNALSPITTTGDLIIGNGTNSATRLPIGANGYLLTSNGTTASWVAAPATGVTSFSAGTTGLTPSTGTTGAVTLAGTLAIANGGTNSTATPTAGGAGYGTGTAHAYTAAGTAGQVLTSAGTSAPVWSGISGGTF